MKHTANLIMPVDNCIPASICRSMIEKFENLSDKHIIRDTDFHQFKELNISQTPEFESECKYLQTASRKLIELYREQCNVQFWPADYTLEEFRMKRYDPNETDMFDWHVDVGDYASARRFIVTLYYLNTVEEGGETAFDWRHDEDNCIKVEAIEGSCVMFPPHWMYPHKGLPPISGPKYIISSYGHYL